MNPMIVAVDGPAGSGKSSLCAEVCQRLGFTYVNTGALYRACAVLLIRADIDLSKTQDIINTAKSFALHFQWDHQEQRLIYMNEDLTPYLNEELTGKIASHIAKIPEVRQALLPAQRTLALSAPKGAIIDGRDIGTIVFPHADVKIFLTASLQRRAERRLTQLIGKKLDHDVSLSQIIQDMSLRDAQDECRDIAPLRKAPDAILIDTSDLNYQQSIDAIIQVIAGHSPMPMVTSGFRDCEA